MIYRFIYSLAFCLAFPFIILKLFLRSRKNINYRYRIKERLGFAPFKLSDSIWIHSVSVGESIAIAPLVKKIVKAYPNTTIIVTTMTPTGSEQVCKLYKDYPQIKHSYLPYDLSLFINLFIHRIKPKCLVIMETELWPNLLHCLSRKDIPVFLTNARLSSKSAQGYQKILFITKQMMQDISFIAAQTEQDALRFQNLSLPKDKLQVTGSIKYDIVINQTEINKGKKLQQKINNRPVWIAASTHKGEDEVILKAHKIILTKQPNAILILVPRHLERFKTVTNLSIDKGFNTITRSSKASIKDNTQVFIGDSIGEMMVYYFASDLAFIGGSIVNTGGHNMLEPASLGKPCLSGANTFNFLEISNLLIEGGALITVYNCQDIAENIIELFSNKKEYTRMSNNALAIVKKNQGALNKQFAIAKQLLAQKGLDAYEE